jgi:hypothetical protein
MARSATTPSTIGLRREPGREKFERERSPPLHATLTVEQLKEKN